MMLLVFVISLFSGNYYSDDFCLYLAVIGLSGLFLQPKITLVQMILGDILLVLQYVINPGKADPLGQFIMCIVCFSVACFVFFLTIKRGRAYIDLGRNRAEEAEDLIVSMKKVGGDLQDNYDKSSERIDNLQNANNLLEVTYTITWEWAFEGNNAADTILGNIAAGGKAVVKTTDTAY